MNRQGSAPDPLSRLKAIRHRLGASQTVLARFLGVSVASLRAWERDARPELPIARRFLVEFAADPGLFLRRMAEATKRA